MIRRVSLVVSFLFAGVGLLNAQTHQGAHPQGRPHDAAGHGAMDPAQHAAMHALLLGSWKGTSSSGSGAPGSLTLAVATDKTGKMALKIGTDLLLRVGAISNIAFEADTLRWTQVVSGAPCKAMAVLSPASQNVPEALKGTIGCDHGEIKFDLRKAKG